MGRGQWPQAHQDSGNVGRAPVELPNLCERNSNDAHRWSESIQVQWTSPADAQPRQARWSFQGGDSMLYEFVTTYRDEIIAKTRVKVSTRPWPPASTAELENGLPMFLTQLAETLRWENTDYTVFDAGDR